jgi:hypothetical protein
MKSRMCLLCWRYHYSNNPKSCKHHFNVKGILICLGVLQSELVQPLILMNLPMQQLKTLEDVAANVYVSAMHHLPKEVEMCKLFATNLLEKIIKCKNRTDTQGTVQRGTDRLAVLRSNMKFKDNR